jgi:hypothetical protein
LRIFLFLKSGKKKQKGVNIQQAQAIITIENLSLKSAEPDEFSTELQNTKFCFGLCNSNVTVLGDGM